jgi:hypothetical protein
MNVSANSGDMRDHGVDIAWASRHKLPANAYPIQHLLSGRQTLLVESTDTRSSMAKKRPGLLKYLFDGAGLAPQSLSTKSHPMLGFKPRYNYPGRVVAHR